MEGILLFCITGVIAAIFFVIYDYLVKKKEKEETNDDTSLQGMDYSEIQEYESVVYDAEVISGRVAEHYDDGIRTPRYCIEFFITFLVDGEELEYLVPKETFECAEKGQKGVLIVKNDLFMSFDKE